MQPSDSVCEISQVSWSTKGGHIGRSKNPITRQVARDGHMDQRTSVGVIPGVLVQGGRTNTPASHMVHTAQERIHVRRVVVIVVIVPGENGLDAVAVQREHELVAVDRVLIEASPQHGGPKDTPVRGRRRTGGPDLSVTDRCQSTCEGRGRSRRRSRDRLLPRSCRSNRH